jgi:hypothetical protein
LPIFIPLGLLIGALGLNELTELNLLVSIELTFGATGIEVTGAG